jgi:hypothetical protein
MHGKPGAEWARGRFAAELRLSDESVLIVPMHPEGRTPHNGRLLHATENNLTKARDPIKGSIPWSAFKFRLTICQRVVTLWLYGSH